MQPGLLEVGVEDVKALSVRQPWAELILAGRKRYELRTWRLSFRGQLWIHASSCADRGDISRSGLDSRTLTRGAVVGSVEVIDCLPLTSEIIRELVESLGYFGDWQPGLFAWALRNPRRLPIPVPLPGRLGLFDVPELLAGQVPATNAETTAVR